MSGGDVDDLERIAENAYQLEISEGNRCGRQDQWAAAFGGFNRFVFIRDKVEIMPFEAMNSSKNFLRKHLLLVDSGIKHNSGSIQDGVWSRYDDGDSEVHEGLQIIRLASRKMVDGIQRDQRHLVVESLIETCRGVDLINTEIHDPFREVIKPLLAEKSVMGWKALGAGAGGIAALLCSPIGIKLARDAMNSAGWEILEWDFEENGVQVL
jgi:D-glycero-alpha-D-manno-heptose-7-phosphate kinase